MAKTFWFRVSSQLTTPPNEVWRLIGTMAGVNRELFPFARMTYPAHQTLIAPDCMPLRRRAFRSWIWLFGIIPIDYDDITFMKFYPSGGFVEDSTLFSMKIWRHERTLEPTKTGCLLTDQVSFVPRISVMGSLFYVIFTWVFHLRHYHLRRTFGYDHQFKKT